MDRVMATSHDRLVCPRPAPALEVPTARAAVLAGTSETSRLPTELPPYAVARLLAVVAGLNEAGPAGL